MNYLIVLGGGGGGVTTGGGGGGGGMRVGTAQITPGGSALQITVGGGGGSGGNAVNSGQQNGGTGSNSSVTNLGGSTFTSNGGGYGVGPNGVGGQRWCLVAVAKKHKELTLVDLVTLLQHLLLKVQMVVKVMASFSILVVTIDTVVVEAEAVEPLVQLVVDSGPKVLTVVRGTQSDITGTATYYALAVAVVVE